MNTTGTSLKSKVLGNAIISVLTSMDSHYLAKKYLAKHNFDVESIESETYYELQNYLNLLNDIHKDMPLFLSDIGRNVFSQAKFPPEVDTLEKAYNSIGTAYQLNHKNDEASTITCTKVAHNKFQVRFNTPYPSKFNIGILQGIALAFHAKVLISQLNDEDENHFAISVIG